ncbi:ATP-grasp domain-containing protein [Enterobacter sp. Bisph1]|uniref:ATP-grasp domain-containing protein n=1 Tax=Enterobacter sp. Bisph1 TaxID=1274399 RepID=UPI00057C0357|nr:ATP-grasp domain-containing protein [Enterobacter sp. Bisph1]
MNNNIWLMEGLSSQKQIISHIKLFCEQFHFPVTVFASHRNKRHEILSVSDYCLIEPRNSENRLQFIRDNIAKYGINTLHAGTHRKWFAENRAAIEACGVTLTTGAMDASSLKLADDKAEFADVMAHHALPVVPSWRVNSHAELQAFLAAPPFNDSPVCVKPVAGIYGMGFWRFDENASPMALFNNPDNRIVQPQQYLAALSASTTFTPLVAMPYLPGPEYSVDILADNGEVLAAVGRRKEGAMQYLVNEGEAVELACACARIMKADGLVNVQTRNDNRGKAQLLEINMRPSGGIGYILHSGVNLPGLFAVNRLGLMSKEKIMEHAKTAFYPVSVRTVTDAIICPESLANRLNEG